MDDLTMQTNLQNNSAEDLRLKKIMSKKRRKPIKLSRIIIYAVLILYAIWIMAPFFVVIITSFTPDIEYETATGFIWWPKNFTLDGYKKLFLEDAYMMQRGDGIPTILLGFINMLWMTLIPLVSGLTQSLLVAYCYSKWRFPFKNTLFMITISLMFIPLGAFSFVSYMFYNDFLHWTEGWKAFLPIMLPGMFAGAGTVFFLRPYIDGIGGEIVEAAKIDGMGFWQIFVTIIIPLAKPALIAQFIFGFVGGYNNYTGALLYLQQANGLWTLQIAIQELINFSASSGGDYAFRCATMLMAMLPLIIIFLFCQKYFIEGISFGGGKE